MAAAFTMEEEDEEDDDDPKARLGPNYWKQLQTRADTLRHLVARDPLAADVKLTLFASAVYSHRYTAVAHPVPAKYMKTGGINELTEALDAAPALRLLLAGGPAAALAPPHALELLQWLLSPPATPDAPGAALCALPRPALGADCPSPSYLFKVDNPSLEQRWGALARGKKTVVAFLGQPLDVFHSIVHHGIQSTTGDIRLRRTLKHALENSVAGYGLGSSELGARLRCVAECECVVEVPGLAVTADSEELLLRDGKLARVSRLYLFKSAAEMGPLRSHSAMTRSRVPIASAYSSLSDAAAAAGKLPEFRFEVETAQTSKGSRQTRLVILPAETENDSKISMSSASSGSQPRGVRRSVVLQPLKKSEADGSSPHASADPKPTTTEALPAPSGGTGQQDKGEEESYWPYGDTVEEFRRANTSSLEDTAGTSQDESTADYSWIPQEDEQEESQEKKGDASLRPIGELSHERGLGDEFAPRIPPRQPPPPVPPSWTPSTPASERSVSEADVRERRRRTRHSSARNLDEDMPIFHSGDSLLSSTSSPSVVSITSAGSVALKDSSTAIIEETAQEQDTSSLAYKSAHRPNALSRNIIKWEKTIYKTPQKIQEEQDTKSFNEYERELREEMSDLMKQSENFPEDSTTSAVSPLPSETTIDHSYLSQKQDNSTEKQTERAPVEGYEEDVKEPWHSISAVKTSTNAREKQEDDESDVREPWHSISPRKTTLSEEDKEYIRSIMRKSLEDSFSSRILSKLSEEDKVEIRDEVKELMMNSFSSRVMPRVSEDDRRGIRSDLKKSLIDSYASRSLSTSPEEMRKSLAESFPEKPRKLPKKGAVRYGVGHKYSNSPRKDIDVERTSSESARTRTTRRGRKEKGRRPSTRTDSISTEHTSSESVPSRILRREINDIEKESLSAEADTETAGSTDYKSLDTLSKMSSSENQEAGTERRSLPSDAEFEDTSAASASSMTAPWAISHLEDKATEKEMQRPLAIPTKESENGSTDFTPPTTALRTLPKAKQKAEKETSPKGTAMKEKRIEKTKSKDSSRNERMKVSFLGGTPPATVSGSGVDSASTSRKADPSIISEEEIRREAAKVYEYIDSGFKSASSESPKTVSISSVESLDLERLQLEQRIAGDRNQSSPSLSWLETETPSQTRIWSALQGGLLHDELLSSEEAEESIRSFISEESENIRREFEELLLEPIFHSQDQDSRERRLLILFLHSSQAEH